MDAAERVISDSDNSLLAGEAARWLFEQENEGDSYSGSIERILEQGKQFPILCGLEVWIMQRRNLSKTQDELERIAASPNSPWLKEQSCDLLCRCKRK